MQDALVLIRIRIPTAKKLKIKSFCSRIDLYKYERVNVMASSKEYLSFILDQLSMLEK